MTVGIYVPLLAWWVVLLPIAWKMQANPTFFIGAVGSLMLLVAGLHSPRSEMAIPYRFYGIVLVGATLVLLSFHWFNEEMFDHRGAALEGWRGADDPDSDPGGRHACRGVVCLRENRSSDANSREVSARRFTTANRGAAMAAAGVTRALCVARRARTDSDRALGAHDRGQHRDDRGGALADPFRTDGRPESGVRGGSCLSVVVGRSPLH